MHDKLLKRRPLIAVIGDARLAEGDTRLELAERCGKLIIDAGFRLVTGGLGGVMEAASRGAHHSDRYVQGDVIGLLPGKNADEAISYVDIAIPTGLDVGRNLIIANSDALIAIGGGPGTLSEIALAWQMYRLIIALKVEGVSGKLAGDRLDARRIRYPDIEEDCIYGADTAEHAIDLLSKWLPRYTRWHEKV